MTLFFVMIAFIIEVLAVIEMGKTNGKRWHDISRILNHKNLYKVSCYLTAVRDHTLVALREKSEP